MLPLHRAAQGAQKGKGFHAGLWYERFFNQYDDACNVGDHGKIEWIKTVTGLPVGDKEILQAHSVRQQSLITACGGQSLMMRTDWHFVLGMGNNHPVENGFSWHHTLGVPYLTGAAVKGMVRTWCEVWLGWKPDKKEKEEKPELNDDPRLKQWFGDTKQSGQLIFFDAIPTKSVQLKADIMTPHYGDWYAKGGEALNRDGSNVPADWHNPVPIPFLAVDKDQSFQFGIAKRPGSDIDFAEVLKALSDALQFLGAGAKTAAGYGRMQRDKAEEARIEQKVADARCQMERKREQERQAMAAEGHARALGMAGLALAMVRDAHAKGWARDKGKVINEAGLWLGRIASEDSENLGMAANWLAEQMDTLFPGIMSNPDKVRGKKARPVFKQAQRDLAHRLIDIIGA